VKLEQKDGDPLRPWTVSMLAEGYLQPQRPPCAPHIGVGIAQLSAADAVLAPTLPTLDSIFSRSSLPHAGHADLRSEVTNASNAFSHSRHWNSKSGITVF
jgi:hypothetical protein